MTRHPLIVTIDVEDWPQSTFDATLPITSRVERDTRRMMNLLAEADVRATMFVLAPLAELFPGLVRELHEAGHEIASHGYGHVPVFRQTEAVFRADVRRAKQALEDCIGAPVHGYRAPDFSIITPTLWALDVLAEEGYTYDSSIFPMRTRRYGIAGFPHAPVQLQLNHGNTLVELPIGIWQRGSWRLPVGGGGYHRLLPGAVARHFIRQALADGPFMFYCHPYEIDPREFAELDVHVPWRIRMHQGLGRGRFAARMRSLVEEFGGCSVREALGEQGLPEYAFAAPAGRIEEN